MPKTSRKPAKRQPYRHNAEDEINLRRFCIEQAVRWPQEFGRSAAAGVYPPMGLPTQEADVVGRAKRIYEWVTAKF